MLNAIKFLKDSHIFYLATTDGDQPRVRPLGFVMDYNGKICFGTANNKEMYKQMQKNPKIEIVACVETKTLRITGEAETITTPENQEKALNELPMLKNIYSVGDGKFEIFTIKNAIATYSTMTGEKKEVKL